MVLLSRPLLPLCRVVVAPLSLSAPTRATLPPRIPTAAELVAKAPAPTQKYLRLIRADKPTGTLITYWPAACSLALASPPALQLAYLLALFGLGAFTMRSAAVIINDYLDRDYDRKVERTRDRPLASGEVTTSEAAVLLAGLLSTSLAVLCQLKTESILVGASSILLVAGYPLAKRYTHWPQIVLGATLNWGVLIGFTHVLPPSEWYKVIPFYAATCLHTFIYDTIYAHQDKKDDIAAGVCSSALRLGEAHTRPVLAYCSAAMIGSLAAAGLLCNQTWPYYVAVAGTAAHLGWQLGTVDIEDAEDCGRKFRSNAYIGPLLLAGILAGNLLKKEKKEKS